MTWGNLVTEGPAHKKGEYIHVSRQSGVFYRYICRYDSMFKSKRISPSISVWKQYACNISYKLACWTFRVAIGIHIDM